MIILTCCDISLYCYPQCKPYHVSNKALIIGDAAHAMVPFFAQGMNSVGTFFVVLHYRNTRRVDSHMKRLWMLVACLASWLVFAALPLLLASSNCLNCQATQARMLVVSLRGINQGGFWFWVFMIKRHSLVVKVSFQGARE